MLALAHLLNGWEGRDYADALRAQLRERASSIAGADLSGRVWEKLKQWRETETGEPR